MLNTKLNPQLQTEPLQTATTLGVKWVVPRLYNLELRGGRSWNSLPTARQQDRTFPRLTVPIPLCPAGLWRPRFLLPTLAEGRYGQMRGPAWAKPCSISDQPPRMSFLCSWLLCSGISDHAEFPCFMAWNFRSSTTDVKRVSLLVLVK